MSIKWTIFLVFASVIITGAYFVFMVEDELALYARDCNIAGISLRGDLMTYIPPDYYSESGEQIYDAASSEDIVSRIREADKNENIKAVLLEVDSYGGYPVAAEEVMRALLDSSKPTVALIRAGGLSAAYLSSTGADWIIASRNSDVGSIGVTSSYVENVEKNKKDGLTYQQLNVGKFKDAGDPNKQLSGEEKELILRDLALIYESFVESVAKNRHLPVDTIRPLADGSSMLGTMALKNKLIDQLGGEKEALAYLENIIQEEPSICWD
ncbi:hypothetical protein A3I27_00295 [Candidatus Giovannonibacteria bacterium RIFCSPLOWO2_02_FULL_43_11b]|uniref:Peptidase S49 domain-containing protein n=1 Tax=Candidatus Giovannonibacteria bacterium RIFCSPHIGHO2_12_FULL_43_15 TaxID=1798341 RepID=A0A1F5WNI8_9BACT|nr:MAG: hypothetical protein A2739_02465 [Candidatus Giovannonibacteria bacterium RIFCSPHIGHO2_01_FULL_43_100]OGF65903.1 MAG: hypothetical protein A3B97_02780 [Candidatus Giovannonibacteria bacterium RIFCSPHIGHO2_02_FULL_43_32]OGF77190.1 MAG: hypothetical protein A3F23_01445 [Candidatus Giovannonibacteria bacterium RIFCSPHIGHO2_12_FULL_43_15]OGF78609.1 MAG: hypothetical protein A3A15_03025 [Candidatus Giovannonibacteria bacterium RIFCSPLOWO2_01_FULL_43_60]OGF90435.1 MAG: hypothetical protein A3